MKLLLLLLLGLFWIASASNGMRARVEGIILRAHEQYSSVLSSPRKASSISDSITRELYMELPLSHFKGGASIRKQNWNQVLKDKVEEYRIHKGKFNSIVGTIQRYYRVLFGSMGYVHSVKFSIKKTTLLTEINKTFNRVTKTNIIINEDNYIPITLYIMISLKDSMSNEIVRKPCTTKKSSSSSEEESVSSSSSEESTDGSMSLHEKPSLEPILKPTPKSDRKLGLKLSFRTKALRSVIKEANDSSFDCESICRISNHSGNEKQEINIDIEPSQKKDG